MVQADVAVEAEELVYLVKGVMDLEDCIQTIKVTLKEEVDLVVEMVDQHHYLI